MEAPDAQILPFRRPDVVIFERFDAEDMAALFRSKQGHEIYFFTLRSDGTLEVASIEHNGEIIAQLQDFTEEQKALADRLVARAREMLKDQLKTWQSLDPSAQLSLLIAWGQDTLQQMQESICAAVAHGPIEYAEDIAFMCQDIQNYEAYLAGLETARSLL